MISLTTPLYDPSGILLIPGKPSNLYEGYRRGSVTSTLDGSVSVYDSGYSSSDQTLKVLVKNPTKAMLEQLRYLVAYYSQVNTSCDSGFYSSVLSFILNNNSLNISLKIVRKLN